MIKSSFGIALLVLLAAVTCLNNGLGRTPAMGYSSWNDCEADVTESHIKQITTFLIQSGLAAKGFTYVNIDEGWLKGRFSNGTIMSDPVKFPSGMKGMGDWIHSQSYAPGKFMKYGLYTSRGTCQCSSPDYSGPGSQGHEVADAQYFAYSGADYLKEDSCCGSQVHDVAFADYARMRDALNATGRPIYFSLCGWEDWYAPVGMSLGNSWRIAGDGSGWGPLTNCFNVISKIYRYAGPGGWNDPDLLIAPSCKVGGQTDNQARSQFSLWATIAAPLLISSNLLTASPALLETYGNTEVIAIDQDPLGRPGWRWAGSDLAYPCSGAASVTVQTCEDGNRLQQWALEADGTLGLNIAGNYVLDVYNCGTQDMAQVVIYNNDHGTGTCHGRNQQWKYNGDGTLVNVNANKCLDAYEFVGPLVDLWTCNGGANQVWTNNTKGQWISKQTGLCLTAPSGSNACSNVWGRSLQNDTWSLTFVNNGAMPVNVTCDAACFAHMSSTAGAFTVRDVWAHADVTVIRRAGDGSLSFSAMVDGDGSVRAFKLTPASSE